MLKLEPLRGIRRWLHRKCGITIGGNLFVLDEITLNNSLLTVEGTCYVLSLDDANRVKQTMGLGTTVTDGTLTTGEGTPVSWDSKDGEKNVERE